MVYNNHNTEVKPIINITLSRNLKLIHYFFTCYISLNCSCCHDCTELTVEVTYNGANFSRQGRKLNNFEEEMQLYVKNQFFPLLDWMANLKSLALVKLGRFTTNDECVYSRLLKDLLRHIFRDGCLDSLQRFWVHQFVFNDSMARFGTENLWTTTPQDPPMKSFCVQCLPAWLANELQESNDVFSINPDQRFDQLEHLAVIFSDLGQDETTDQLVLRSLKYARVEVNDNDQVI